MIEYADPHMEMTAGTPQACADATAIIPTKNRPNDLVQTLESLLRQTVLPRDIIIVDQSQANESRDRVEALWALLPWSGKNFVRLEYIHDPAINGLTAARNAAMEKAIHDYWVFLDDDVILEPDFLEELLAGFQRMPEVAGMGGIITNYPRPPWSYRFFDTVFVRGPFHDERQRIYWRSDALRNSGPVSIDRLTGAHMAFRAVDVRHRRFDGQLRGSSDGEDVEFSWRLGVDGRLRLNPRARLAHKRTPTARSGDHWLRAVVRANTYLYRRLWRDRLSGRICYSWLMFGYFLLATLASIKSCSAVPWRALLAGIRDSRRTKPA